jgi:DHA1 family bicyclomycin/chloramphenicol resistance-like MFS transporter
MLDLYPGLRGAAASVQSFVAMVANAVIAGVLAPLLAGSLWTLAAGALAFVLAAWAMWSRHLAMTRREPVASPDAAAYEPTDEF